MEACFSSSSALNTHREQNPSRTPRYGVKKKLTRTESTEAEAMEAPPRKRPREPKAKAMEIPKVILESSKSLTRKMSRVQKNVVSPGKTGAKSTRSDGKTNTGKGWNERKKQSRQKWRQSKERLTLTFTDEECLFMKLMKGASEEDWIFFLATLNVTTTREFTTMRQGAFAKQSPYLGRGATSQLVSKEGTSCVIAPFHVQTE